MRVAIGQSVYSIPAKAGVSPEDSNGLIILRRGARRYCQDRASAFIEAQQVYFRVPSSRLDRQDGLILIASLDSRTPGPQAAPRWTPFRSAQIEHIKIGSLEGRQQSLDSRLPIRIELHGGRVQELKAWCANYPQDSWIASCRVSLPLADGNILEVSTGGVPANATAPISQDIINGLHQVELLKRSNR